MFNMQKLQTVIKALIIYSIYCDAFIMKINDRPHRPLFLSNNEEDFPLLIPSAVALKASEIEIVRVLGKIDIVQNPQSETLSKGSPPQTRATSVRVFEARILTSALSYLTENSERNVTTLDKSALSIRCFLKEFLPAGEAYGRRELSTMKKLTNCWNTLQVDTDISSEMQFVPFPLLLGQLRTDERIVNDEFKNRWLRRFPRTKPPESGNLWLIYQWDETSFKTLRSYPALPQIIQGFDYFSKEERNKKRWAYIRKIMKKCLESIDFLHRSGFCHNAISSDAIWMTTTNQLEIDLLNVRLTDLGAAQRLSDLGPYAREGVFEDLYQLGFVFLEIIFSSFSEDDRNAVRGRIQYLNKETKDVGVIERIVLSTKKGGGMRSGQLTHREWQSIFENHCDNEFQELIVVCKYICGDASELLERNCGDAFKLLLKLLARGRLVNSEEGKQLPITGRGLIREFAFLSA